MLCPNRSCATSCFAKSLAHMGRAYHAQPGAKHIMHKYGGSCTAYRATQGGQDTSGDLLQQLGTAKLPSALQYLSALAAAAVADGMFRLPGPSVLSAPGTRAEDAAMEAPSTTSADFSVSGKACRTCCLPGGIKPRRRSLVLYCTHDSEYQDVSSDSSLLRESSGARAFIIANTCFNGGGKSTTQEQQSM